MAEGWKSPATMIALAGLVLSVAAFSTGRFDQGRLAKLEENKLQLEQLRTDLDTEIRKNSEDREARRAAISEQRRKELQSELSEVQRNIAISQDMASEQLELHDLKIELANFVDSGLNYRADATRRKIDLQKARLDDLQHDLETLQHRRSELEKLLSP